MLQLLIMTHPIARPVPTQGNETYIRQAGFESKIPLLEQPGPTP